MTRWAKTGWTWVALLVGVGLVELTLVRAHLPTLSQFVQHYRNWWVKVAVISVMALFTWHLLAGTVTEAPPEPAPVCLEDDS